MSLSPWPFDPLRPLGYGKLIADPAWDYELYSAKGEAKSAHAHYRAMPDDEILSLPVGQLAARDCAIWLWCTAPRLDFGMRVLKAWGFRYVTFATWLKVTRNGKDSFGTGYWMRSLAEPVLIGAIGSPAIDRRIAARTPNLFRAQRREHSRKPDSAHRYLDGILPHAFGAELFARESRDGWASWGNEATKFDGSVDPAP
ncbi:MAG: MT-A70 family methyltransferase [Tagaea sp.]|nr:MT-A70 family methyltransferase [Tagaea sp.]